MSGPDGTAACEAFIEALGLKTLFSVFMGKVSFASALGPASKHNFKSCTRNKNQAKSPHPKIPLTRSVYLRPCFPT